ncbi:MAG: hypothetical protein LAO03_10665 [Acidobacteriia bacterium]|nr:hypothetical protein [Terriglobia bacterium]
MRGIIAVALLASACLFLPATYAQQRPNPGDSGASASPAPSPHLILREGTEVLLKYAEAVNSRTAQEGDMVEFVLAEDLTVGNTVIAEAGSRAVGAVVHTKTPDAGDSPGELNVRMTFLKAGKTKVPLRGTTGLVGDIGVVLRGTPATIDQATTVKASVAVDTEVQPLNPVNSLATAAAIEVPADRVRLAKGRIVRLMVIETVSSKTAKVGEAVKLQVIDPVKVSDLVVIASEAPASGTITEVHPASRAWRKGGVVLRLDSVTLVNQQQVALAAVNAVKGGDTQAAYAWTQAIVQSQGLALLFLPFAPLQHGQQATIPKGAVMEATTAGEILLDRASVEASQPPPPEKKQGPASATIYYPKVGDISSVELWCGSIKLGKLKRGHKLTVSLPPGKYWFRVFKGGRSTLLEAKEGGEYYLRTEVEPLPSLSSRWEFSLSLVEHDIGEVQAGDTKPLESKNVPDISTVDLAQLQADPNAKH